MSRLFEALKEASRFRGRSESPSGLLEAWGISGVDLSVHNGGSELAFEPETASVESDSQELEPAPPESLGKEIEANLDQKARLIPHAIDSKVVEHYRRLRTKILQQQEAKPFRTLLVTSASPQEGKTLTVLNLGLSFATLPSFRVLVVDGDMRRGTLGTWLGVKEDRPGLSNLLEGSASLPDVVLKSDRIPMHFIVRGSASVQDLHPSRFAQPFQAIARSYDLVIVDSPPVNLLADVQLLAAHTDAVLLIARAFSTSRKSFEKAVQDMAPFRVIGSVLNGGVVPRSGRYHRYY